MPLDSLPAIGCAGTKQSMRSRSARRAASTTSRLVLPASISSTPGSSAGRMAFNVASVAATGTATSTMSQPAAVAAAESAEASMAPSASAWARVDGVRL